MTNAEKFIEIMNETFNAGLTFETLMQRCSPCGYYKDGKCDEFTCKGCEKWWRREDKSLHSQEEESK